MDVSSIEKVSVVVRPSPMVRWQAWLRQYLYLLPEGFAIVVVLGLHLVLASPPWLAMLGLVIVGWFGARLGMLILARRALRAAIYPRAKRLSEMALALNPYSADAHALCGIVALAYGQCERALYHLTHATNLAPQQATFHTLLSAILLEANQEVEAQRSAQQALDLNPHSALAHLYLAEALLRQGSEVSMIEALLQQGLKHTVTPTDEAALCCALGDLLYQQGRHGEANLHITAASALLAANPLPQRASLHFYLGRLLQRTGAIEAAHEHFAACATLDPQGRFAPEARQFTNLIPPSPEPHHQTTADTKPT